MDRQRQPPPVGLPSEARRKGRFRSWDNRFGRGYAIVFLTGFVAFWVGLLLAIFSSDRVRQLRSLAACFTVFGSMFVFGILYQVVRDIGFGWSASLGTCQKSGVLERKRTPFRHWLFVSIGLAISCTLIALALWMWVNTATVAAFLARHPPTETGG
jgi:hypothetical protein